MHGLVGILLLHINTLIPYHALIWYTMLGVCALKRLLQPSSVKTICDTPVQKHI